MKITLTHAELAVLVRSRYDLPANCELEISGYSGIDHPDAVRLVELLSKEGCLSPAGAILYERKIASIKLLRELICGTSDNRDGNVCGLAQAKFAIEDWGNFLLYVRKSGFPPMGTECPDRGWLEKK